MILGQNQLRALLAWLVMGLLFASAPARAEWRQVRTAHFTLTIDDTEESARDFGMRLERFDSALRRLYNISENPDQLLRPITIYALRSEIFYAACRCPGALGYYRPRVQSSYIMVAHVPEVDRKSKIGGWSSQTLLLHEYSHHFAFFHSPIAYPGWFSEGFAEFNANASFEPDGSVIIGYPANYRAQSLQYGDISIRQLLEPERFGSVADPGLFYGRGWLLTHYLMLSPGRTGQLAAYLDALNHGKSSLDAATGAFGDLKALDKELDAYQRGNLLPPVRIPPDKTPPAVTVTTLPKGQAEMLPTYLLFQHGVGKGYALGPLLRARDIAEHYPDDAIVQAQLAELEYLGNRIDYADQAADRALKLKPDLFDALIVKGNVALARAKLAKSSDPAVWKAVRAWFVKANHADPNAVMPLFLNYTSYIAEGRAPSPSAIKGLMRAAVLAPESAQVRTTLARQMLADGDAVAARALLQPIAFAPHSLLKANVPRQVIALIDAGKIDEAKTLLGSDKIGGDDDEMRLGGL
jgi:tetratricopeptide (TPR) repeat protein